jgi:hypothetical protein
MGQEEPEETGSETVTVTVDWGDVYEAPLTHVNQFLGQIGIATADGTPDGVCLVLGNVGPPVLVGDDPEALKRQIEALKGGVRVSVHGRFQMSRGRLEELINVLQQTAGKYDAAAEAAQQTARAEEA